jgi:hypothetical protein
MALTPGSYTPTSELTDAETGAIAPQFQDVDMSRLQLANGNLRLRLSPKAFPKLGQNLTGTDSDGNTVPPTAKTVYAVPHWPATGYGSAG